MRNGMSLIGMALAVVALIATAMPANAQGASNGSPIQEAQSLIARGMTVQAAAEMKAFLAFGQGSAQDWTTFGDAERFSGDFRTAVQAYTAALRMMPTDTPALDGLALTYAQAGDYNRGIEIVRTGLSQTTEPASRKALAGTLISIQQMRADAHTSIAANNDRSRG